MWSHCLHKGASSSCTSPHQEILPIHFYHFIRLWRPIQTQMEEILIILQSYFPKLTNRLKGVYCGREREPRFDSKKFCINNFFLQLFSSISNFSINKSLQFQKELNLILSGADNFFKTLFSLFSVSSYFQSKIKLCSCKESWGLIMANINNFFLHIFHVIFQFKRKDWESWGLIVAVTDKFFSHFFSI